MIVKVSRSAHFFLLVSASCIFVPVSQALDLSAGYVDSPSPPSMAWNGSSRGIPPGWSIGGNATNDYRFSTDTAQGLALGQRRADIFSTHASTHRGLRETKFATLMQAISAQSYVGKRIHLSAELSTAVTGPGTNGASGRAALWMRVDDKNGKVLKHEAMESNAITDTDPWRKYDVVMDVPAEGASIAFGFMLVGSGHVSASEFSLDEVGDSVSTIASVASRNGPETLPTQPVNLTMSPR